MAQPKRWTWLAAALLIACNPAPEPYTEAPAPTAADRVHVSPDSDARAIELAQSVVEAMGGWESWEATRFVSWNFFGNRRHWWDRWSGDIRIEGAFRSGEERMQYLILMNIHDERGRAFDGEGREVQDPERLAEVLRQGQEAWINDSYWMFMPYKLLDPGVTLRYGGERAMEDGRMSDVLDLTFAEGTGVTPQNRYEVFVARDTGLVEQWAFFAEAGDEEPRFTMPWKDWTRFGRILLATGHGRDRDWEIEVYTELPRSVFESPEPVSL